MKSQHIRVLLHVLEGIFEDATLAYPELKCDFLRDKERIALNVENRDLTVFTLDLPNLDSLLLRGLETGRLALEGPLSHAVSKRTKVPRLFSGLWLRIFSRDSSLKPDVDVNAIAFLRQFTDLGKKLLVTCSQDRIKTTVKAYHGIEKETRQPSLDWDADELHPELAIELDLCDLAYSHLDFGSGDDSCQFEFEFDSQSTTLSDRDRDVLQHVQQVADMLSGDLGRFDPLWYSTKRERDGRGSGFRHGPGAVADRLGQHEKSCFPRWPLKLEGTFRFGWSAVCAGDPRGNPINHEIPSRLMCVPKTAKSPRLIAAEPIQHQWCQQLIWAWLEDRLGTLYQGYFVDFRNQKASSDLVLSSSLDGKLATVDLSDASDRLSCWTVERVFRKNPSLLRALHAARTRWLHENIVGPGSFIKLKKFASQGTATTFPVQSIVFLIASLAASLGDGEVTMKRIWRLRHQVRVYGDDIIIPVHGYERLIRILDLLGLKANIAKSYVRGKFRESCGVHGYLGYDVTPVTPKTIVADGPASVMAVLDTSNNLFYKGYWHASNRLAQTIPLRFRRYFRIVGATETGSLGFASYSGGDERHLASRWNHGLHRYEVRTFQISGRSQVDRRGDFPTLLDFTSSRWSPAQARTPSEFRRKSRSTKLVLRWEPSSRGCVPRAPSIRSC